MTETVYKKITTAITIIMLKSSNKHMTQKPKCISKYAGTLNIHVSPDTFDIIIANMFIRADLMTERNVDRLT